MKFSSEQLTTVCRWLLGHRQIAGSWMQTTAICHRARLVTFDKSVASLLATPTERAVYILLLSA